MQTIYYNGCIIKMDDDEDNRTEAVLVEDGVIKKLGSFDDLRQEAEEGVKLLDLQGKTLMPAFIDAHSHITMASQMMMFADLTDCTSFSEIIEVMDKYQKENSPLSNKIVVGFGYDHNVLQEERHPDKKVLDKVNPDIPVVIIHASGHMGVVNSKVLETAGVTKDTKDPAGGRFGRYEEEGELDGYAEEAAFMQLQYGFANLMQLDMVQAMENIQNEYLRYGITTAQDGAATAETIAFLQRMAQAGKLKMDVVAYPMIDEKLVKGEVSYPQEMENYEQNFRVGGYKMILDGSPQGKSAWLSKPYEAEEDYRGYPWLDDDTVVTYCKTALRDKKQLLAHCNGDAASQQFIDCYQRALDETEEKPQDLRPVMIHCQTVRKDQLERMADLKMIASVFVGHVYYWGDVHLKNLGEERGKNISPAATAKESGLWVTFHQDTPVTRPHMLHSVWCGVTRKTKKGVLLNQQECLPVYEALKAITINAAYQYHEEEQKGSIAVGKRADFVVLDGNPLSVPKDELCHIRVIMTIKDGKVLYTQE